MLTRRDADSKAEGEGSVNDASHEDDVSATSKIGGQILADSDDNHDGCLFYRCLHLPDNLFMPSCTAGYSCTAAMPALPVPLYLVLLDSDGTNAPMRQCANAPMRQCANAPMRQCADAPTCSLARVPTIHQPHVVCTPCAISNTCSFCRLYSPLHTSRTVHHQRLKNCFLLLEVIQPPSLHLGFSGCTQGSLR